jgi:allantoicase
VDLVIRAERAVIADEFRRAVTHISAMTYPDGGIALVRVFGRPTEDGTAQLQAMWESSA